MIEISNDDIEYGDAIKNEAKSNVIDKTIDNLDYCKDIYNRAFIDIAINLKTALEHMQRRDVEKIQDELGTKVCCATNIVNNPNVTEVFAIIKQILFQDRHLSHRKKSCLCP